jgi:hypothetical protein
MLSSNSSHKLARMREGGDPCKSLFQRQKWILAFAGMTPNRWQIPGKLARMRGGGDPYNRLFQRQKWIPAFAGMTQRRCRLEPAFFRTIMRGFGGVPR